MNEATTVIGASAGTGKTHRLTSLVLDALAAGLAPEGLVGVTFTKKAASELTQRLEERLYHRGEAEAAQRLGMAYLGTTHSVGLRLIAEYAIEAGLSPEIGVLPEDPGPFLRTLIESVLPPERLRLLDELAGRLRIRWDNKTRQIDWHHELGRIVDAARMNRVSPAALPAMAERSYESFAAYLDPVSTLSAEALDAALLEALEDARSKLVDLHINANIKFAEQLDENRALINAGVWEPWEKYARLELSKKNRALAEHIHGIAGRHLSHPRLRADLRAYLVAIYAAAAEVLAAFAEWKKAARVVDHTDQLELAWRLLALPDVAASLRARIGLIVVDELQDSNPLQLALFTRLHALAGRSAWVGDPKQCIFEWNGADPTLVDVILAEVRAHGHEPERLTENRRSRPELVTLASELFAAAFAEHGLAPDEVRVRAYRTDPPELAAVPPVGILRVPKKDNVAAIAQAIRNLLDDARATPVVDRRTGIVRPVEVGDIAVLVATNEQCEAIAAALDALGIRAACARSGLLETPEGRAVTAGLALIVAPDDGLAEAELELLCGDVAVASDPAAARAAWVAQRWATTGEGARGRWSQALAPVRHALAALTPRAVFERVLEVLDLPRCALGWHDGPARVSNLDALRALTTEYEALERARGRPATVSGLLRALAAVRADDPETPLSNAQHLSEHGAVQVLTYYKAKGLEWPVVVLATLDNAKRRDAFEIACESDADGFSLDDPLASRWVRYWPWPFLPQKTGALDDRVAAGDVGQVVQARDRRERVRLLYVGFTRARDHLIVTLEHSAKGEPQTAWLDELARDGAPCWRIPAGAPARFVVTTIDGEVRELRARAIDAWPAAARADDQPEAPIAWARPAAPMRRGRRDLSPSRADDDTVALFGARPWTPRRLVTLGPPLTVTVPRGFADWDRLGSAVHGFLASDRRAAPGEERHRLARRWLERYEAGAALTSDTLIEAADRLDRFLVERWPGAARAFEIPIQCALPEVTEASGAMAATRLRGTIDLLIAAPEGRVLIDHKSFPAPAGAWKKAASLAPQLAAYAHALRRLDDSPPLVGVWFHFPLAGVLVALDESPIDAPT